MTPNPRANARTLALRTLCLLVVCLVLPACAMLAGRDGGASAADAERAVDMPPLDALMGDWYVVGRVPWFGERGRVASRVTITAEDDSRITIQRQWRDGFGEPLQTDTTTARSTGPGHRLWKVRAWRVLPARLRVFEVAGDGSWMLLGADERDHAWILTRAQVVGDDAYLELERRIRGHGVNTDRLRRVAQVPEQEGRLGFEPASAPSPGK